MNASLSSRSWLLPCAVLLWHCVAPATAETNVIAAIPFNVARGHVMVPARVNDSEPLSFLLDTGYSITMIHPDLIAPLKLERVGEIAIVGIAGEEKAGTFEGAHFDLGGATYSPRRVAALSSEGNRRRRRDGILGAGLFRQFVIELDFRTKLMRLYAPTNFVYRGAGEIVSLGFRRNIPTVSATVTVSNREPITAQFEIDTGCDGALCLGHDFVEAHKLLEAGGTEAGGKTGVGGGASTRRGYLSQLQLGNAKIDHPPTDFFLEGSPVDRGLAGHIGLEALRQFKVIFDYSRRQMILEK